MTKPFQPMRGVAVELDKLRFPVWASPKLDGMRCPVKDGIAYTKTLHRWVNDHTRNILESHPLYNGLDGEMLAGDPTELNICNKSVSAFQTKAGEPEFRFYAFDITTHPEYSYRERQLLLCEKVMQQDFEGSNVYILETKICNNLAELLFYEEDCLRLGYEGIMIRDPEGPYKYGQSTMKEQWLLKMKRFKDAEAIIIGVEQLMQNTNAKSKDLIGNSKRATNKKGMKPLPMLGAFVCVSKKGVQFNVGGGPFLTHAKRRELWDEIMLNGFDCFNGQYVWYRHFAYGELDAPRSGQMHGFRPDWDITKE